MKSALLSFVAAVVLVGCSCENNTPAPVPDASTPAQGVAAGEPNPATPAPAGPAAAPVDGEATLKAPTTATAGATFEVAWTGPGNAQDYVDLAPRAYEKTSGEISYSYVRDTKGTVSLRAPVAPGEYDIRYVLDMGSSRSVKARTPLTVTEAGATLTAPATAETGQALSVAWTGPDGKGDYVDLVKAGETKTSGEIIYAYTSAGSPAKLEAPSAPGNYEIRYLLEGPGGRKVIAASPLAVSLARASLKAPASVARGAKFRVEWTGPKSSGDYVDLIEKGSTATSGETSYFYLASAPELTAPAQPGDYEVRYVLDAPGGRVVLARTPVSVR